MKRTLSKFAKNIAKSVRFFIYDLRFLSIEDAVKRIHICLTDADNDWRRTYGSPDDGSGFDSFIGELYFANMLISKLGGRAHQPLLDPPMLYQLHIERMRKIAHGYGYIYGGYNSKLSYYGGGTYHHHDLYILRSELRRWLRTARKWEYLKHYRRSGT